MSKSNFDIKLKEHFKLYISIKDKISLESELLNNNIQYYFDFDEQSANSEYLRYYFLVSEKNKVNEILNKTSVISFTESNITGDFKENGRLIKLVIVISAIFIGILFLISIFFNLIKS